MKVKLSYCPAFVPFTGMISVLLLFVIFNCVEDRELGMMLIDIDGVVCMASIILSFVLSYVPTVTVTISGGVVEIRYIIGRREIPVSDITGLDYKRTGKVMAGGRGSRGSTVYRSVLHIAVSEGENTHTVTLNDNANTEYGDDRLPEDEIPLYNVYRCLQDLTGIDGKTSDDYQWEKGFWGYIINKSIKK